jgi:hypothetical protein
MVTILVGKEEKPFAVNKNVVCSASEILKAKCQPLNATGFGDESYTIHKISLPDEDPGIFNIVLYWMFKDEIGIQEDMNLGDLKFAGTHDFLAVFIRLFVIGSELDMPNLRNDALDALALFAENWNLAENISDVAFTHVFHGEIQNPRGPEPMLGYLMAILVSEHYNLDSLKHLKENTHCAVGEWDLGDTDFWHNVVLAFCSRSNNLQSHKTTGQPHRLKGERFCQTFHTHDSQGAAVANCSTRKPFLVFKKAGDEYYSTM